MNKDTRDLLISTYVRGIEEAMNTCKATLEAIKQDLELSCITVAMGVNIETRLSYVKQLQELIDEGFKRLDALMSEEPAA